MTLVSSLADFVASSGPLIVTKATLVLLLMLLAARLVRRTRASARHLLLTAGFGVLLVLPLAIAVMPPVHVEVRAVPPVVEEFMSALVPAGRLAQANRAGSRAWISSDSDDVPRRRRLLAELWAGGVLLFACPVLIGFAHARRLRRTGRPWLAGQRLVDSLTREAGLRRPVEVLLHERIAAPATAGITRHAILFPVCAATWSNEDIQRAAIHEVEHVRRGDCFLNTLVHLICAVYWFHPLAWVASRQLALEAERASDDAVLRHADATAYADQLVTLAERLARTPRHPLVAMASRSELVQRVTAILDQRQPRGHTGTTLTAAFGLAAVIVVAALAPIQGRGQTVSLEPLVGLWDMQRTTAGDSIVLRLCYAELFSRSEFAVEQVTWRPSSSTRGEQIRFALTREAGSFAFEGNVENNVATGRFTFEPSSRFEEALRQRGQPSLTPSQYLALAQHDIGLAAIIEATASQRISGAAPWLIHIAQARAWLEEAKDRMAKSSPGGVSSPGVC
jgi:beta-lactamase regulating signal transducer with metallopeptidase domain